MQGLESVERSHHLNGQLTVVLYTQDRPAALLRSLQYYRQFDIPLLVVDSSAEPCKVPLEAFGSLTYRHSPESADAGLGDKLVDHLPLVSTPFIILADDTFFPLLPALSESVDFLLAHTDYGFCQGYSLMFHARAGEVEYYRRDRKVHEDYNAAEGQPRVMDYMRQYLPPFNAVTRTALVGQWVKALTEALEPEWLQFSHAYFLLSNAKARILPIPYALRELENPLEDLDVSLSQAMGRPDQAAVSMRERRARQFAAQAVATSDLQVEHAAVGALQCMEQLAQWLATHRSATLIIRSSWRDMLLPPQRSFLPTQYVEMPFYNQPFFALLEHIEFLLHALPAGRLQLQQLEGIWISQEALLQTHANDTPQTVVNRLWAAMDLNVFNLNVVQHLAHGLGELGNDLAITTTREWAGRLTGVRSFDNLQQLHAMPSWQLMQWLKTRTPNDGQARAVRQRLERSGGGPQFAIMLLDLDQDMEKLQTSLDSLLEGLHQNFRIVVFTGGEPPVATTIQNTVHFIKVGALTYIDKLNQFARQSTSEWLVLAQVGDQFTHSGLARAALELLAAPECRAVAADEIHRGADGALSSVFRPGFNLDLLESIPRLMARHWLIRRDVVLDVGGYSAHLADALEFDLLLRVIEKGGMGWLAHLDEPLLICEAPHVEENAHERLALIRHLGARGYQALVTSECPGSYRIEYGHSARPLVSVLLPCQDNLAQVQANLQSLRLRTRYINYEVLLIDNASQDLPMEQWLDTAEAGWNKVRVLRSEQPSSVPALYNAAARQAKGEYLVLLDSDAQVVNPNWIESLLNHAQRPEVGIVGAKLVNAEGQVTQAGLLLGFEGGVGAAFAGEPKDAPGYLQRLSVDQNYSAVSGACLMIGTALFQGVGGLDDDLFAESLSDVDLCLKVGQAGYLTVWTPYVQVIHPGEIVQTPTALVALRGKWAGVFAHDLAYNRNLSQRGSSFALGEEAPINWAPLLG